MEKTLNKRININELLIYSITFLLLLLILQNNSEVLRPHSDSLRYIQYSVNINQTGYFGLPGEKQSPGNQNMPLYPFFVSSIMDLSQNFKSTILCLSDRSTYKSCSLDNLKLLFLIQAILMLIPLVSVWYISNILFSSRLTAWLSGLFCLASGRLINFSGLVLTEAILIPLFSMLLVSFLLSIRTGKIIWTFISVVIIGLLTLTRPEYIYLFYFFLIINLVYFYLKKQNNLLHILLTMFIGFYLVVGPWMARNIYHFNSANLTSSYASVTLVQRLAYNRMSLQEWGTAFVYWFPDMGDSIAKRVFPESYYEKLTYDTGSYYLDNAIIVRANAKLNNNLSVSNLLKVEILQNLVKHCLVTIPIFWKGIFVGKLWGVLGLLCFIVLSIKQKNKNMNTLLLIGLPLWIMVALHAFVSINIPRYNIFLVPYLSIYIGFAFSSILTKYFNFIIKDH